jgi:peptide/nickel transport system substrate-binding protein
MTMTKMTRRALHALSFALGLIASTIVTSASAQQPTLGGTLNVSLPNDAKSLDPTHQINFTERQPLYLIFNTLVALTKDFSYAPELAERWEFTEGGRRLVMNLRQGVKFHDGTDFDSAAVKWNIEHRLNPATASPSRLLLAEHVASVETDGPHRVIFVLKGPAPTLLGLLAQREGFMISPSAAARLGKEIATKPVGTGPFVFKEWDPGNRLVVEKNPAYWEPGKPYLDRIVFLQTSNTAVGVPRLMTRELDFVAALSPIDVRPLANRPGIQLSRSPGNRWMALQLRIDRPPFDNAKLRQAMAHAIDRKRINDIVMDGKADIAESPTPPGLWWFSPDVQGYAYDPAKARALLAEPGVKPENELVISVSPVAINQQVSQLAQEQLQAVGLNVRIAPVSISDWYPQLLGGAINFLPIRWSQRPDPDGLFTYLYHSKSGHNSSRYISPELDALLDRARGLEDREARRGLYKEAQAVIVRDLPYIYLFHSIEFAAMRDDVRNFVWIPDEIPRFREVWKSR